MRGLCRAVLKSGAPLVVPAGRDPRWPNHVSAAFDRLLAEASGTLCGGTGTNDCVDASLVLTARREGAIVPTSDVSDLHPLGPTLTLVRMWFHTFTPGPSRVSPTLALLARCIVASEHDVTLADASALLREINDILEEHRGSSRGHPIFSFLSVSSTSDRNLKQLVGPPHPAALLPPIDGLADLFVYLPAPIRQIHARARVFGDKGVVQLRLGNGVSQRWEQVPFRGSTRPGSWGEPVILEFEAPIPAGWNEMTFTGGGVCVLTGLVLATR